MDSTISCGQCGATFANASNLSRHEKEVHAAARLSCVVCGKNDLYNREKLQLHLSKCTGPTADVDHQPEESKALSDSTRLLSDVEVQQLSQAFLVYLDGLQTTFLEAKFIQARLTASSRELALRNLKFLFNELVALKCVTLDALTLRVFCNVAAVQLLHTTLVERKAGPGRIHQLFLLIAKVLLHIASLARVDRPAFQATELAAWSTVQAILHDASKGKKKRENTLSINNEKVMSKDELRLVATTTMKHLEQFEVGESLTTADALKYQQQLFVASLANLPTPRSQVFRHLQEGTTLVHVDGRWQIQYDGSDNAKSNKPLLLTLPEALSTAYDVYLSEVRPLLIVNDLPDPMYVFPNRLTLQPRDDFNQWTRSVTNELIGKPINPHAFRHSLVTSMHESGAAPEQMVELASMMQHSSSTQAKYYRVPKMLDMSKRSTEAIALLYTEAEPSEVQAESPVKKQRKSPSSVEKAPWSEVEVAALRAGVDKHGAGNWAVILRDEQFRAVLSKRTSTQTRAKWFHLNNIDA